MVLSLKTFSIAQSSLSPHTPSSQALGASCVGRLTPPPGSPRLCCPTPTQPSQPPPWSRMPSRLCRRVFLLQAEGLLLSVHSPLEGLLPPQTTTKQARPQPDPQDAGDSSSSLKLGAAPEVAAARAGGPASGHSDHWAGRSNPQTRSGPRARARAAGRGETHSVCRGMREKR